MALYDILEARKFKVCLTNARHTKNLPGRKGDVQESQWLLKLHTSMIIKNKFGLLKLSEMLQCFGSLQGDGLLQEQLLPL